MRPELADLHRHLDGSIRPATLRELSARFGFSVPPDLKFRAGMGLQEALSKFAFTLSLLQRPEEVKRVASEICEDAAGEGVTTLEIRFAPQLHKGASVEEVVDAALAGIDGRAGLILCGLHGEPLDVLLHLVDVAASRPGVVAIDLAGGPVPTPETLLNYQPAFKKAQYLGIGRTCHASEGRTSREIRVAIEELGAQRVGHGTTLLEDPDIVNLLVKTGVTVEACLLSNVHVDAIARVEDHRLADWLRCGVKACINTDNTLLSETSSPEEHARASGLPGMTDELFHRAIRYGHEGAFPRRSHD